MLPLERIRRLVEAGERLSHEDLASLEREAARASGASLRLALAHAWSNAGEDRRALELMERLHQEFPRDIQVRLGQARALAGMERYREAEAVLTGALRMSPDDPEALKALALLALRRGEPRKADAMVSKALERDPFDAEARLVREELRATELPQQMSKEELLRRVRPVLRPRDFAGVAKGAIHKRGPADLSTFYVADDPDLLWYIPRSLTMRHKLSLLALDTAAFRHLEAAPAHPQLVRPGVWALAAADGYDSARLLCASERALLKGALGPPPYHVNLDKREYVLLSRGPLEPSPGAPYVLTDEGLAPDVGR